MDGGQHRAETPEGKPLQNHISLFGLARNARQFVS